MDEKTIDNQIIQGKYRENCQKKGRLDDKLIFVCFYLKIKKILEDKHIGFDKKEKKIELFRIYLR